VEPKTSSSCSQNTCTRIYPKAVHQKLLPNDGVRVRRVSDSRTISQAAGTLREEKPYVHTLQYCEYRCYAQNGRMSVWP
jgi:hypothetical protein